jgi:hypothetical protein
LTVTELTALGVRHAFTTRHHPSPAWVSAPGGPFPSGSRWPALLALGIDATRLAYVRQVHGVDCLVTDDAPASAGPLGTADAVATATGGAALAVFTADCLPIVLVDPGRRLLALVHAGWRGTVQGIAGCVVRALVERLQARPDALHAVIGPSIGPCCYEVDEPVVGPLRSAFPANWERWVEAQAPGKWRLDLWRANEDQLATAGVPRGAIRNPRLCTGCGRDLFFSYRKEGQAGRLATLAVLA